jgi:predicted RNA-binding protein with PIN domain
VCGCWPELKPLFHTGQIEKCRNLLIEELSFFRDTRVLAVFDATGASSSAPSETAVTQRLTTVYVSDADEYIDRELSKYTADEDLEVFVVTSDNLTRSLAGTGGASLMHSLDFHSYLKELKSKDKAEMKILSLKDGYRGTLRFALNQDTRDRLLDMKRGLRDVSQEQQQSEETDDGDDNDPSTSNESNESAGEQNDNSSRTLKEKSRRAKMKKKRKSKKKKKFKSVELPSSSPLSQLGQAADSKLLGMRQRLSPPEDETAEAAEEEENETKVG